jgi:hypothetical protein
MSLHIAKNPQKKRVIKLQKGGKPVHIYLTLEILEIQKIQNMPLTFGDTHPSVASVPAASPDTVDMPFPVPLDTADMIFSVGNLLGSEIDLLERKALGLQARCRDLEAEGHRLQRENAALHDENRNLHRLATAAAVGLPDNPAMHAKLITDLQADKLRLEAQVRVLHAASRRANDAWETKHIFGFALSEPLSVPEFR